MEEGKTIIRALHDKYEMSDEDLNIVIYVPKSYSKGAPGSSGDLVVPSELNLHESRIETVGDEEELCKLCADVTYLDLAGNCISSWSEIVKILQCLKKLEFLNISGNPLSDSPLCLESQYPNIQKLVLNKLNLPFETLWQFLSAFPNVRDIYLNFNGYQTVDVPQGLSFPTVERLHFNDNSVFEWEQMAKLGRLFPNLTSLVMIENPIIEFRVQDCGTECFSNLKSLNISQTGVRDWPGLEELRYLPCLDDIRMKGLPFLEGYEEEIRRQLAIGYLPNVRLLNGSRVQEAEREDAERAFIRYYMERDFKPPRYYELESIYGKLDPLTDVKYSDNDTVTVTVHHGEKSVLKQLCISWTKDDIKRHLQTWVNMDPDLFTLFYQENYGFKRGQELNHPTRTVSGYRMYDGDMIHVAPTKKRDLREFLIVKNTVC